MKHTRKVWTTLAFVLRELEKDSSYKFSAKARYALAKNLRLVSSFHEDCEKARVNLVRGLLTEGVELKPGTPEHDKFVEQYNAFMSEEEEIPGVLVIDFKELDLEKNQIPVNLLADLMSIVTEPS
jgi:hypothetical protein